MNQHLDHAVYRLIASAANSAPAEMGERLHEEWLAHLHERGEPLSRLKFALGCWWAAFMIRREGITVPVLAGAATAPLPVELPFAGRRRCLYSRHEPAADVPRICEISTTPLILILLLALALSLPTLARHLMKLDLPGAAPTTQIMPAPSTAQAQADVKGLQQARTVITVPRAP